ncbi:hypothetical protein ACS0TY_011233 [Phlomoides rotata]
MVSSPFCFSGNTLTFLVGDKQAFKISLADVAQTQLQGKNEVTLEFHIDDTTGANEKPLIENSKAGKKEAVKPKEEAKVHACGVTKKPKDPIVNIDAEDADNELMQKPLIENAKVGKKDAVKPKEEVVIVINSDEESSCLWSYQETKGPHSNH